MQDDAVNAILQKIEEKQKRLELIDSLVKERPTIEADIGALRATLKILGHTLDEPKRPLDWPTSFSDLGLSQAIQVVLRHSPDGMRPIEVCRELEKRGFSLPGQTTVPLDARVAAEMSRLAKAGKIMKLERSRYRLSGG